jgi:pSer/pThr/pTyr-binding forkhead associated (FHA) protein
LCEYGDGEQEYRAIDLPGRTMIVGRHSDADLRINHRGISKRHAQLTFFGDCLVVEDLQSTNGTYVNGIRVATCSAYEGDIVQFAHSLFRVCRKCLSHDECSCAEKASSC